MSEPERSLRLMVCVVGLAACSIRPLEINDENKPSASVDAGTGSPPVAGSSDGAPVVEPRNDAALPAELLSCLGLPATCGANGDDSCCNSPEVAGGNYYRSYDLAGEF